MKNARHLFVSFLTIGLFNIFAVAQSQAEDCGNGLPQRMVVGGQGQALNYSIRVRQTPDGAVIGQLDPFMTFDVIEGPECASNFSWWHIETEGDIKGWIAEGTDNYFVEPLGSPTKSIDPVQTNRTEDALFSDDFSSNAFDWETAQRNSLTSDIIDGKYVIRFTNAHESGYWLVAPGFRNWSKAPILNTPYEMQFDITNLRADDDAFYIAVLFDVGRGYLPFKRLLFNNSEWLLVRWTGRREDLDWGPVDTASDLLDGERHTISLRVEVDKYTLLIDGQVAAYIGSVDPIDGTIGLGLDRGDGFDSEIYAEFDNLVVKPLSLSSSVAATGENKPLVNENPNCDDAPSLRLKVGQTARVVALPDQVEWYYGHPLVEGGFFSVSAYIDLISDPEVRTYLLGQLASLGQEDTDHLITEGPICFNGSYLWKIEEGSDPFWIAETVDQDYQLAPSPEQPSVGEPTFEPKIIKLLESASAPILSAEKQILFSNIGGGGPGEDSIFVDFWRVPYCGVGSGTDAIGYYANACITLYPFPVGSQVQVRIWQPDGTIFSEENIEVQPIQLEVTTAESTDLSPKEPFYPIEAGGVFVALPHTVGLQRGVWTIEASSGSARMTYAYSFIPVPEEQREGRSREQIRALDSEDQQLIGSIANQCDGPRPLLLGTGFESNQTLEMVLVETVGNNIVYSGPVGFHEAFRWPLTTGEKGELVLQTDFVPPNGYFVITDETGDWRPYFPVEDINGGEVLLFQEAGANAYYHAYIKPTKIYCPIYHSREKASIWRIGYGDFISGMINDNESEAYYMFDGSSGDNIIIDWADDINPQHPRDVQGYVKVRLEDPDGNEIPSLSSDGKNYILPIDGEYTIVVSHAAESGSRFAPFVFFLRKNE